jgi:hypothetical protein
MHNSVDHKSIRVNENGLTATQIMKLIKTTCIWVALGRTLSFGAVKDH